VEYLNSSERLKLLTVAMATNPTLHLMLKLSFAHGLRVTELLSLTGADVSDGKLSIVALKNGISCRQPILIHSNPLIDCSPVIALSAKVGQNPMFPMNRVTVWRQMQTAGKLAGLDPKKCHPHACRHSTAMFVFETTQSLGQVSSILRHRSPASSMTYLRELDASKAIAARDTALAMMVGA
jgi:integrase